MSTNWDLTIYNRANQLALAVEVKNRLDAPPEWAARLRRNILAHDTFPNAPYFLMVFPDRFYLWKDTAAHHEPTEPTYVIDARPVLQPFYDQSGVAADQVSEQSLELMVASWLHDIMHKRPDELEAAQHWLIDSGFYQAVVGGRLEHEVLV